MSEREKSAKVADVGRQRVALYRKYRGETLDDIIAEPQVTEILAAQAKSRNFAHAYLFTGQRGTGKTTTARILAHLINETPYGDEDFDIIEIDAASAGSVDDARELREKANLAPLAASHKIYIIDEVHMLSTAAFNALLKLIEEPPAHVVFILATTEVQKLPATILSRVQRFHFRPVGPEIVAKHLREIAKQEKIAIDDEALLLIAERGGGSFRDSITLLDQLASYDGQITRDSVEEILGLASARSVTEIISAVQNRDAAAVIKLISALYADGLSAGVLTEQLIREFAKLATEKPRLYGLVEQLLDVAKSSQPDLKLLAILAEASARPTSAPAIASRPPAPIVHAADEHLATVIEKNIADEIRKPKIAKSVPATDTVREIPAPKPADVANAPAEIDWKQVLDEVKKLNAPFFAILNQANYDYENGVLTLYFSHRLYRTKCETQKYREILAEAFRNLYKFAPEIVVAKSAKAAADSKNSLVAGVAAIMGGGEVVKEPGEANGGKA